MGERAFTYREQARFWHSGKPFLGYEQRTWAVDDGRPLHTESGYWRATEAGDVELILAHAIGNAEIELGRWHGDVLRLESSSLSQTPTARPVTRLERDIELRGDILRYELRMATGPGAPWVHLRAELRRRPEA